MVQTFLPYDNIEKSLICLDDKRLGKQRVEAFQILRLLLQLKNCSQIDSNSTTVDKFSRTYKNHPAVLMWEGSEKCLQYYLLTCMRVWSTRKTKKGVNFSNQQMQKNVEALKIDSLPALTPEDYPNWWKNENFFSSHRAMLFKKNPVHYNQFQSDAPKFSDYAWPIRKIRVNLK